MARMSLRAACDQARQWLETNDLERAIGLCEHILQEHPTNLETYRMLGEGYLASHQLDRSQAAFDRLLHADPENIPGHVGLGIAFERRGQLDRAVQEFEQALEIRPDMQELRSQLLRLYTEGGIEHAQLRLSRAGLARLYAKGQMLPQAIAEFRHVIAAQPDRYDAKVALAETLWRDDQDGDAITFCQKLVSERPDLLKARLLLGYLQLSQGRPEGQDHWQAAAAMDPDQVVARAMFDQLPPVALEPLTVSEWDERFWRQQREEQEQIAATRPMEAVIPTPLPEPTTFTPGAGFFAERAAVPAFDPNESDDFLASLLDVGSPAAPVAPAPEPVHEPAISAEELGLDADMQPFSLSDLGLSEDEIAGLDSLEPAAEPSGLSTPHEPEPISAPVVPAPVDEPPVADLELNPFSFSLDEPDTTTPTPEPSVTQPIEAVQPAVTQPIEAVQPAVTQPIEALAQDEELSIADMAPFSLADLGLSEEEIAALNSGTIPSEPAEEAPVGLALDDDDDLRGLPSFSLDEPLPDQPDLPVSGMPNTPAVPAEPVIPADLAGADADDDLDLAQMQPFSLGELGLNDAEIAMAQPAQAEPSMGMDIDLGDLPVDLQPFAFDSIDQEADNPDDMGDLPSALQPFSLESPPSGVPQRREPAQLESLIEEDEHPTAPGYSWQQPAARPEPGFVTEMRHPDASPENSVFAKLVQRHEQQPPPPAAPVPDVNLAPEEDLGLFSIDNVSLRGDEPGTPVQPPSIAGIARREGTTAEGFFKDASRPAASSGPLEIDDIQSALASGQIEPFSLAELGLSDEELEQFSPAPDRGLPETGSLPGAITAEKLEPFSLEELGLSGEEIAALGIDTSEPVQEPVATLPVAQPVPAPETQPQQASEQLPDIDNLQDALESDQVQPFSLDDFGLSDDEVAAFGMDAALADATEPPSLIKPTSAVPAETGLPPAAATDSTSVEEFDDLQHALESGQVKPFSFADLGLSDEEVAALGLESGLSDVTEPPTPVAETNIGLPHTPILAEVMPVVEEPLTAEPPVPTQQPEELDDLQHALETGQVQPFSFADLGLSAEEIASLGFELPQDSEPAATVVPEPDLPAAGLKLDSDLGTGDIPFLDLGLDEDLPPATADSATAGASESLGLLEEDLLPFSLADMGMGESIDIEETPAFGLADNDVSLGLTDDELAGLDIGESNILNSASAMPPTGMATSETGDPAADRLLSLGRSQGFVDISDIIAAVDNPEDEAERIEAIGQILHTNAIEIRDGNEVVDMDAEYDDEDYSAAEPITSITDLNTDTADQAEPDMTPFSLSELGLTDEEIALLGGDSLAEMAPVEPAMTPVSLGDLDQPGEQPSEEEADMTPFSLSELGLSEEDMGLLDVEQPATPPSGSASVDSFDVLDLEPPVSVPEPAVAPTIIPTPAPPVSASQPPESVGSGNTMLDQYLARVEQEPENHALRLSVARAGARFNQLDLALRQYKQLIRRDAFLDDIVDDLVDLIADNEDANHLRQLHRMLGDAYTRQNLIDQAMQAYSWTPGHPKAGN